MSTRNWRLAGSVGLVSAALLLAACGGSDSGGSGASAGKLTKVSIGVSYPAIQYGPAFLAKASGAFEDEGLDVEFKMTTSTTLSSLAGGAIPVALISAPAIESGNLNAGSTLMKWLGTWDTNVNSSLLIAPDVDLKDPDRTLKAVFTSATAPSTLMTKYALDQLGVDASRIRNVTVASSGSIQALWAEGEIDVRFSNNLDQKADLAELPGSTVAYGFDDIPWVWGGLAVNAKWLKENPDTAVALVRGLNAGLEEWHANPADAQKALVELNSAITPEDAASQYEATIPVITKSVQPITLEIQKSVLAMLKEVGEMPTATPDKAEQMFDNSFVEKVAGDE